MTEGPLEGRRFSHQYISRGEATDDAPRLRGRLAALMLSIPDLSGFGMDIERELGVRVSHNGRTYEWRYFLHNCPIIDVLDLVTLAHKHLLQKTRTGIRDPRSPEKWIAEVSRIFVEENVRYRVDKRGGVHFAVDQEFERNTNATIGALATGRYTNARTEFSGVDIALSKVPPNGKEAIRSTFTAAEGLFRLIYPDAPRLSASEISKHMPATLKYIYSTDQTALRASSKLLASFQGWTDAAHFYRHEPGEQEIAQPPLQLAINLVSQGTTFIRWLAEIDGAAKSAE